MNDQFDLENSPFFNIIDPINILIFMVIVHKGDDMTLWEIVLKFAYWI